MVIGGSAFSFSSLSLSRPFSVALFVVVVVVVDHLKFFLPSLID